MVRQLEETIEKQKEAQEQVQEATRNLRTPEIRVAEPPEEEQAEDIFSTDEESDMEVTNRPKRGAVTPPEGLRPFAARFKKQMKAKETEPKEGKTDTEI